MVAHIVDIFVLRQGFIFPENRFYVAVVPPSFDIRANKFGDRFYNRYKRRPKFYNMHSSRDNVFVMSNTICSPNTFGVNLQKDYKSITANIYVVNPDVFKRIIGCAPAITLKMYFTSRQFTEL